MCLYQLLSVTGRCLTGRLTWPTGRYVAALLNVAQYIQSILTLIRWLSTLIEYTLSIILLVIRISHPVMHLHVTHSTTLISIIL
jgi:hypothetical protein